MRRPPARIAARAITPHAARLSNTCGGGQEFLFACDCETVDAEVWHERCAIVEALSRHSFDLLDHIEDVEGQHDLAERCGDLTILN